MPDPDNSILLIDELRDTYAAVGPANTLKALRDARSNPNDLMQRRIEEHILSLVCEFFKITNDDLLNGASKGTRVAALNMVYYLCRNRLKYTLTEIKQFIHKDISRISRGITVMNTLKKGAGKKDKKLSETDKQLIEICDQIDDQLKDYINQEKKQRNG